MDALKKLYRTQKLTKDTTPSVEHQLGLGLQIKTAEQNKRLGKKILINETIRDVFMDVRIKNKTTFELKCSKTGDGIRSLNPTGIPTLNYMPLAISLGSTYYCKRDGESSTLPKGHKVIDLKHLMYGSLEEEFYGRIKDLTEACAFFGVDASKYNYNERTLTRVICYSNVKYLQGCQHVTLQESEILDGAMVGALNYADCNRSFANGYGYDVNSFYPFVMSHTDFRFPVTEGKWTSKPSSRLFDEAPLEVRKLEILGTHKYWRNSPDNYYDTYQMQLLDLLGIPYKAVDDRCLRYSEPVKSSTLFSYFDDLYEMKKNGNKHAKLLLNSCHGQLSRKKDFEVDADTIRDELLEKVVGYVESRNTFVIRDERPFKFVFGRIKNFLYSYVRLSLVRDYILPIEEKGFEIYQIKTDGFTTNAPPSVVTLGKNMGDLKLEKEFEGNWRVKNTKQIIDEN